MRAARPLVVGTLSLATAFTGLAVFAGTASAAPATRYVAPSGSDTTGCTSAKAPCKTIGYAVESANPGDTVEVAAGRYAESVSISKDLTLIGDPEGRTVIAGAGDNPGVLAAGSPTTQPVVVLRDLDISGNAEAPGLAALAADVRLVDSRLDRNSGAGAFLVSTLFTATRSVISRTVVPAQSNGSPASGAGVYAVGSALTFSQTTIADNEGAGISQDASGPTPIPTAVTSSIDLSRSTVSGNGYGGAVIATGLARVLASTVSGNRYGGLVAFPGVGVAVTASTVTGTFTEGNFPQNGGIVHLVANDLAARSARVAARGWTSAAIASPQALAAPRARVAAKPAAARRAAARVTAAAPAVTPGQVDVTASAIVAQGTGVPDCFGTNVTGAPVTDGGFNASSDAANSCGFTAAANDLVTIAPKLGPLADNGGLTETHLPAADSPLLDRVPAATSGAADQRGIARPQGPRSDIGAVERVVERPTPPVRITTRTLPDGKVGDPYRKVLAATGGDGKYAWSLAKGSSLPDGLRLSASGVLSGTPTESGTFRVTVTADGASKRFTLVIDVSGASPNGDGQDPIAETGAPSASLLSWGSTLVVSGFAILLAAGRLGRRPGRHRG